MNIIFCYGGNKEFEIAGHEIGYEYGVRFPSSVRFKLFFADQDWKNPNRKGYMKFLQNHTPVMATVLDLCYEEEFDLVMSWAEEVAQFVTRDVVIIPKIKGIINKLPKQINGKRVVLGYSVPTLYGATYVPKEEFNGRSIHLLGGSIKNQIKIFDSMIKICNIVSIDGNYMARVAWFGDIWTQNNKKYGSWTRNKNGRAIEAFKESGKNILGMWKEKQKNLWNYKYGV